MKTARPIRYNFKNFIARELIREAISCREEARRFELPSSKKLMREWMRKYAKTALKFARIEEEDRA